jgi:hypothetical protein
VIDVAGLSEHGGIVGGPVAFDQTSG